MGINLRTDKKVDDMNMCELAYNDCYVKDRQAMYRNYSIDMSARDLIRKIYREWHLEVIEEFFTDNVIFDEIIIDNLQDGFESVEGILAILYQQIWSKAEIRETLIEVSKIHDISHMI